MYSTVAFDSLILYLASLQCAIVGTHKMFISIEPCTVPCVGYHYDHCKKVVPYWSSTQTKKRFFHFWILLVWCTHHVSSKSKSYILHNSFSSGSHWRRCTWPISGFCWMDDRWGTKPDIFDVLVEAHNVWLELGWDGHCQTLLHTVFCTCDVVHCDTIIEANVNIGILVLV